MPFPLYNVGEVIVFGMSVRHVRPIVRPDRSCCHYISWTAWTISMKLAANIH